MRLSRVTVVLGVLLHVPPFTSNASTQQPTEREGRVAGHTTLRIIPNEPVVAGTEYRFALDTTLTAIDGGRLARPYRFTVTARGARLLSSTPALVPNSTALLDPAGVLTVVDSGAIDSLRLTTTARLEIEPVERDVYGVVCRARDDGRNLHPSTSARRGDVQAGVRRPVGRRNVHCDTSAIALGVRVGCHRSTAPAVER